MNVPHGFAKSKTETEAVPRVLVVFAGGGDTASRLALARELIRLDPPHLVLLSGREFAEAVTDSLEGLGRSERRPETAINTAGTTLASCLWLVSVLHRRFPIAAQVAAVTSNYHAARVGWLLRSLLARRFAVTVSATPDITRKNFPGTRRARKLITGECLSWLYCLPLGVLARILPDGGLLLARLFARFEHQA